MEQLDLFRHVTDAYAQAGGRLSNADLYREVADRAGLSEEERQRTRPIGSAGEVRNVFQHRVRWIQQSMKQLGALERMPGRGEWVLTKQRKTELHVAGPDLAVVGFTTGLGMAIWSSWERVIPRLDEPAGLFIFSPPYALRQPRAYGNPRLSEYVDFLTRAAEPAAENLMEGGSLVINLPNDLFEQGSPARSTFLERTIIAIEDRLGLSLMDRVPWINTSKAPGPMQWASRTRQQLNVAYEHQIWFCKNAKACRADNRRVLQPHTPRHQKLIDAGGEKRTASFGDGAYQIRPGSFGKKTDGKIPRNVIVAGHNCPDLREYRRDAKALGIRPNAAPMPIALARFWIQFLTQENDLVVDTFGGRITTGKAAEELRRRWVVIERVMEYVMAAAQRFKRTAAGFEMGQWLEAAFAMRNVI